MPKYRVEGYIQTTIDVYEEIEADNEEDAINETYYKYDYGCKINDFDFNVTEIKEE